MENKYYTPTIEEFCEGFQYEKRVNTIGEEVEDYFALDGETVKIPNYVCTEEDWVRKTFSNNENQEIVKLLKEGKIRAKSLDREDIESFGFEVIAKYGYFIAFKKIQGDVIYFGEYCWETKNLDMEINFDSRSRTDLFKGTVKNKHELKRILTKINIL